MPDPLAQCCTNAAHVALPPRSQGFPDSPDTAGERLRLSLPILARLGLPADPINYALFYHLVAGSSEALGRELEPVVTGETVLTAELARRLFARYVCESDTGLLEPVRQELLRLLADTGRQLQSADGETLEAHRRLQEQSRALSGDLNVADLPRLVAEIVGTTLSLRKTSHALQSGLSSAATHVEDLQAELNRLRREAATDTLTGALNRRAFDTALGRAMSVARSSGSPLSLAMVDIDHFKQINDTYGHVVGDKVLAMVARLLRESVKGRDKVARYGGEEFALLLPDTPLPGAIAVAESVRATVEASRFRRTDTGEPIRQVTVSLGVARYREGESAEDFVYRCDLALYRSKKQGRNRVSAAHAELDAEPGKVPGRETAETG
jgi:diguanylate cyclase